MPYRWLCMVVPYLLVASPFGIAQKAISVDSKTFNQHVLKFGSLTYPAGAKAAHVQGTVVLEVLVGATGKVESIKTISGSPMLIQAAIDSVKGWTFRPFEKNGSAIQASGRISVGFVLAGSATPAVKSPQKGGTPKPTLLVVAVRMLPASGPDAAIATEFVRAQRECMNYLAAKKHDDATATACKKAADIAEQFAPDSHYIDKRRAFTAAAITLRNSGDLANALIYATKAVDVINLGHDIDYGSSEAYATKGGIEFSLGDLSTVDQDLTRSEGYGRKAIIWAAKEAPNNIENYKKLLGQELRFHANVSLHMNHADAAKKELAEASKL